MNVALHPRRGLNLISLCTGGGGLDLAVELALPDARSVLMVERETFAVGHLVAAMEAGLLAPAPVWSDVRSFDGRPWRGLVDGVIGGIPCQPHSVAGRKRGSLDERDLWSDARRIVVQSRAWFVLIENVAGMLAAGADEVAGAERVWRDLRKLGFRVEGGLFSASEIGAPHGRERLFVLGVNDGLADADGERLEGLRPNHRALGRADARRPARLRDGDILADTSGVGRQRGSQQNVGQDKCEEPPSRRGDAERRHPALFPPGPGDPDGWRGVLARSPDLEPSVRRMADGVAARLDLSGPHAARVERLRMLGNGVVPLQGGYAIRTLLARLAARGSARANQFVRLMEAA